MQVVASHQQLETSFHTDAQTRESLALELRGAVQDISDRLNQVGLQVLVH